MIKTLIGLKALGEKNHNEAKESADEQTQKDMDRILKKKIEFTKILCEDFDNMGKHRLHPLRMLLFVESKAKKGGSILVLLLFVCILSLCSVDTLFARNWEGLKIGGNLREKTDKELEVACDWYTLQTLQQASSKSGLIGVIHDSTRAQMVFLEIRRRQDERQGKLFCLSVYITIAAFAVSIIALFVSFKSYKGQRKGNMHPQIQ